MLLINGNNNKFNMTTNQMQYLVLLNGTPLFEGADYQIEGNTISLNVKDPELRMRGGDKLRVLHLPCQYDEYTVVPQEKV